MQSENFLEYMALQKYISIIISLATIIPIYYLGRHFFSKSYSVLGCAIFVFEPRIVQNSLFGITDPLYLIGVTISLSLFFSKKNFLQYISFVIIALTTIVRSEGIFLIAIYGIIFIIQKGINKKSIIEFLFISLIIFLILFPMAMIRTEKIGNDGLSARVDQGINHLESASDNDVTTLFEILIKGGINLIKFIGWSQIPILIFFVPIGIILVLKSKNFYEKSLIIIGLVILIPTLYAFSFISDSRYLFPLYPIFSIFAVYALRYYFKKISNQRILTVLIFSAIFVTSFFYLDSKDESEHELELYNLSLEISERATGVNILYPESSYLQVVGLTKTENFPISSDDFAKKNIKKFWINEFGSVNEVIEFGSNNGMTHLIIDEKNREPKFLKEVFRNEEKYPFLIKEFDSKVHGYNYHLKIFKIDYEKFRMINN